MSDSVNHINPRKLLLSKWTAIHPRGDEKHFQVTKLYRDLQDNLVEVELLALVTGRSNRIDWKALKSADSWQIGWR